MQRQLTLALFMAMAFGVGSTPVWAHGDAHEAPELESTAAATPSSTATKVRLVEMDLVDQDGNDRQFVSDVIGDRLVVVTTIYTSCTTVCPVSAAIMQQLSDRMSTSLREDVSLVAVSVDPTTDTPKRLRKFIDKAGLTGNWTMLTGDLPKVQKVVDGLGVYTASFQEHPAMILIGDGRTGEWSRFYGFPAPDQLLGKLEDLSQQRLMAAQTVE